MDFWNEKINVSEEAARLQVSIVSNFDPEKKSRIAFEFSNFGISQTRKWIKSQNPWYSDLEINLEFVRIMYYETGQISDQHWNFYKQVMVEKIKKDWIVRFRKMMEESQLTYQDISKMIGAKSDKSVKSTISRGLPAFAKLSVIIYEQNKNK